MVSRRAAAAATDTMVAPGEVSFHEATVSYGSYQAVALGDKVAVSHVLVDDTHVDPFQNDVKLPLLMRTFTAATPLGKLPGATNASVEVPFT